MEDHKRRNYFIVKKENEDQTGGNLWLRYRLSPTPALYPRNPSLVGLYASPLMNRPDNAPTDSIEIARSIGQVKGNPTKTLPGSIIGSPYPGTVTIPNPVVNLGTPVMPILNNPCNASPCDQQRVFGVPGFSAVPIRKGDFTPGVFDIRPIFPYQTYGLTSTQKASLKLTFGKNVYTVLLPYGEINNIIKILDSNRSDQNEGAIRIEISVPTVGWYWPTRIRSRNINTVSDMFRKLAEIKDIKFQNSSGVDMTIDQVITEIVAEAQKQLAESATKSEEERKKKEEDLKKLSESNKPVVPKLSDEERQRRINELQKELAELQTK